MQYRDLPEDAMALNTALDKDLFNTITTTVKGSYPSECIDLTGGNACYTFGIIAVYKHAALTATSRFASNLRMVVMAQIADLKCHGGPCK